MRTFVGIPLDRAHADALSLGTDALLDCDPTWGGEKRVPARNLHITLQFLGELSTESVDALARELAGRLAELAPAEVSFASVKAQPRPGRARMVWAEFVDHESRMAVVAASVSDSAAAFGVSAEDRPFVPHVTLVRARRARPLEQSTLDAADAATRSALGQKRVMSVLQATLYKSTLTRAGAAYESLAEIPIGGPR